MVKRNRLIGLWLVCLIGATGMTCSPTDRAMDAGDGGTFLCLADDIPVETHVGVTRASSGPGGVWYLTYDGGRKAIYRQAAGETCLHVSGATE